MLQICARCRYAVTTAQHSGLRRFLTSRASGQNKTGLGSSRSGRPNTTRFSASDKTAPRSSRPTTPPSSSRYAQRIGGRDIQKGKQPLKKSTGKSRAKSPIERPVIDAYKIAERAEKMLEKDNVESVTRMISKNPHFNLVVTWNHLIHYKLFRGSIDAAFRDFQTMKKTRHFPNEHTYTILFSAMSDRNLNRKRFDMLVNSILEDKRIKLSSIHLNAVLSICAKLQDLPLAYDMIRRFQEIGYGDEDIITYNSLFRIIQTTLRTQEAGERRSNFRQKDASAENRQHLDDAIGIWQDVIERWREKKLIIDSRCLLSFTKLMLFGNKADYNIGIAAISEVCDLPLSGDLPDKPSGKMSKMGNRVAVNDFVTEALLELATALQNTAMASHYWDVCRAAQTELSEVSVWEARLKSLVPGKDAAQARAVIAEMQGRQMQVKSVGLSFAIQCHMTSSRKDLISCNSLVDSFRDADYRLALFSSFKVVTTYASTLLRNPDLPTFLETVRILQTFPWEAILTSASPARRNLFEQLGPRLIAKVSTMAVKARNPAQVDLLGGFIDRLRRLTSRTKFRVTDAADSAVNEPANNLYAAGNRHDHRHAYSR